MGYEFCTALDRNYLPRALVLQRSLAEHCPDSRLWIFCMDVQTLTVLAQLRLPGVVTIAASELEAFDPELRAVKPARNHVEYCWTAKPSILRYALEHDASLDRIAYVDADTAFFRRPEGIFRSLGRNSAVLVPARDPGSEGPRFTTPILALRRDEVALAALRSWRELCLEWCYDYRSEGRWSDLSYLDEWPERFRGIGVTCELGYLGEWNMRHFTFTADSGGLLVDGEPLIQFHYGALWLYRGLLTGLPRRGYLAGYYHVAQEHLVWATAHTLSDSERLLLWEPYVERLAQAVEDVRAVDPTVDECLVQLSPRELLYSTARSVLPGNIRRPLKQLLGRGTAVRGLGPPGSAR